MSDDSWDGYTCVTGTKGQQRSLSIMEICTRTGRVTQVATERGWTGLGPVTIETDFDLVTMSGQKAAWKQLCSNPPDVIVLAWPCDPWSSLQNLNMVDGKRTAKLLEKRRQQRRLIRFCSDVMKWQHARDGCFICENPQQSQAWDLPELQWLFTSPDIPGSQTCVDIILRIPLRGNIIGRQLDL